MRNYFIINGKNSLDLQGFAVNELPPISKPAKRTLIETIDGRDGDIVTDLGYSAYDKSATVGVYGTYDINEIISFFDSEGTIVFSDEPDKFYKFKIINQIDFNALVKFRTAKVVFHCQPFKYELNEEPITKEAEVLTASGSSITLNGTGENHRMSIEPIGKSSQESTSGKQLLKPTVKRTYRGVTLETKKDGLHVSGTVDISGSVGSLQSIALGYDNNSLPAGTYTISGFSSWQNNNEGFVILYDKNGNVIQNRTYQTTTFTVSEDLDAGWFIAIFLLQGSTYDFVFPIMLQSGSTATDYEPYTNGPAPNPDYPYPIKDVTGDNEVEIVNKNFFNYNLPSQSVNDVYFTVNSDKSITANGTSSSQIYYKIGEVFIDGSKSYILSGSPANGSDSTYRIVAYSHDVNGTYLSSYKEYGSGVLINEPNAYRIDYYIFIANAITVNELVFKPMVRLASATDDTYVEHKSQSHLLSLGVENLFNIQSNTLILNNVYLDEIATNVTITEEMVGKSYSISFNSEISNLSTTSSYIKGVVGYGSSTFMQVEIKSVNYPSVANGNYTIKIEDIIIPQDALGKNLILRPVGFGARSSCNCTYSKAQLEEGTIAHSYSPYGQEPIHLRGIGDYRDSIVGSPANWQIKREIEDVVLDGSENWRMATRLDGTTKYFEVSTFTPDTSVTTSQKTGMEYSNYFIQNNSYEVTTDSFWVFYNAGLGKTILRIGFSDTQIDTVEKAKTWLSIHSTEVQYPLANPTYEPITSETLINQLNELYYAYSYEGQTNVFVTSNGEQMEVNLSVLGDDSLTVTNEGNIYSKPTFTVYGEGSIGVYLNDIQVFTIDLGEEEYITIDISNMEAYKDGILKNRLVTGNYNNFKLNVGENEISFSGVVTKFEISNYSRWL